MRLLIISGRSGSGKSTALHVLEDIGFTCIDNLPASLLPELCERNASFNDRNYAISIDARNTASDLELLPNLMQQPAIKRVDCKVIYLDADDDVLIKRYSETRRKHPLTDEQTGLRDAISKEREILKPIIDVASLTIDTSDLGFHDLRDLIKNHLGDSQNKGLALLFLSFGFKYGIPKDADMVFDVRCLPNPHWEPSLRALTGNDEGIIDFLGQKPVVQEMYEDISQYLNKWLPCFEADNRSYVTIAVGCTGGRHRSVYFCNKLTQDMAHRLSNVQCRHRELGGTSG